MSHDPSHTGHDHAHSHGASGNLAVAFFLNLGFALIEVAGGLWTNSLAILTDALHDFGDALSLGIAWGLQRVSRRHEDPKFTYGYRRFSTLGALITGLVLLGGTAAMLWKAIPRLWAPEEVRASGMIALAVLGIAVNGFAVLRLRRGSSLNEQVVSWHLLEDVLGWVAVLLGSIVMAIWNVPVIDPILSVGIALYVLWNTLKKLRQVLGVFLQRAPKGFDVDSFERHLASLDGVRSAHHTHVWTLDGERHVLTTHLTMEAGASREAVRAAKASVRALLDREQFEHVTVDVELAGEECLSAPAEETPAPGKPAGDPRSARPGRNGTEGNRHE